MIPAKSLTPSQTLLAGLTLTAASFALGCGKYQPTPEQQHDAAIQQEQQNQANRDIAAQRTGRLSPLGQQVKARMQPFIDNPQEGAALMGLVQKADRCLDGTKADLLDHKCIDATLTPQEKQRLKAGKAAINDFQEGLAPYGGGSDSGYDVPVPVGRRGAVMLHVSPRPSTNGAPGTDSGPR